MTKQQRDDGKPKLGDPFQEIQEILESSPELQKLPPETRAELVNRIKSLSYYFAGPIPPPGLFAQYESILPGAADRLLGLTENEQRIREKGLDLSASSVKWQIAGNLLANIILVVGLLSSGVIYAVKTGDPKTGAILGGLSILPLVLRGIEVLVSNKTNGEG